MLRPYGTNALLYHNIKRASTEINSRLVHLETLFSADTSSKLNIWSQAKFPDSSGSKERNILNRIFNFKENLGLIMFNNVCKERPCIQL
eukprot:snap_masked-scaffold_1-processed-gene-12.11-mRNA-1 protein AED:1.00 eAED:1.00 QI:0/0/0/0/1/1/2/0/88